MDDISSHFQVHKALVNTLTTRHVRRSRSTAAPRKIQRIYPSHVLIRLNYISLKICIELEKVADHTTPRVVSQPSILHMLSVISILP